MASSAPPPGRDLRLDSLRGLFLVWMTCNHLPSVLRHATDQSLGIFSSAEGFMFISGLLAGWVYTRRLRKEGPAALRRVAIGRAELIYGWQVASFLACLAVVQAGQYVFGFCSTTSPQLFYIHPVLAAVLGAALLHQPGLLDILPMYCAFVLIIPWVLTSLEAGHRLRVLGLSTALWLSVQWAPPIDGAPLYPLHVGSFNLFAWQFLFVLGLVIGYGRAADPESVRMRVNLPLMALAAAVAVYTWGLNHLAWPYPCSETTFGILLNKPALGFLRLTDFGCVAYLVAIFAARYPRLFSWPPFELLGRHSLVVVATQSVVVMVLLQFPGLFADPLGNWLTTLGAIGVLFIGAGLHEWVVARRISRRMEQLGGSRPPGRRAPSHAIP
jgi:hypothetical protein